MRAYLSFDNLETYSQTRDFFEKKISRSAPIFLFVLMCVIGLFGILLPWIDPPRIFLPWSLTPRLYPIILQNKIFLRPLRSFAPLTISRTPAAIPDMIATIPKVILIAPMPPMSLYVFSSMYKTSYIIIYITMSFKDDCDSLYSSLNSAIFFIVLIDLLLDLFVQYHFAINRLIVKILYYI